MTFRHLVDVPLTDIERSALVEARDMLIRDFPVDKVVLFGSKARGDSDAESDVDLLVLTRVPPTRQLKHRMVAALYEILLRTDVMLSPLVASSQDWEKGLLRLLPIHTEVEDQGVAL